MVVHLLKVHFASALESDGTSLEEVDVEYSQRLEILDLR